MMPSSRFARCCSALAYSPCRVPHSMSCGRPAVANRVPRDAKSSSQSHQRAWNPRAPVGQDCAARLEVQLQRVARRTGTQGQCPQYRRRDIARCGSRQHDHDRNERSRREGGNRRIHRFDRQWVRGKAPWWRFSTVVVRSRSSSPGYRSSTEPSYMDPAMRQQSLAHCHESGGVDA